MLRSRRRRFKAIDSVKLLVGHGYGRHGPSCKIFHPFNVFDYSVACKFLANVLAMASRKTSNMVCIASLNDIMKRLSDVKPVSSSM
jgi:hypothetical protein